MQRISSIWRHVGVQPAALNKWLRLPLVLLALVVGLYPALNKWAWFHWHPLLMMLAFIALAGNAALVKKVPGKENTKLHANLMFGSLLLGAMGYYVIYTNKEALGKQHLTTTHGWLGAGVFAGYIVMALLGSLLLDPDGGKMRSVGWVRTAHKLSGRALTAVAWIACVYGFATVQRDQLLQRAFAAVLLVLATFVLL